MEVEINCCGNSVAVNGMKVYRALISQNSFDDPVAIVLENNLGGDVVWTRVSEGVYDGLLLNAFLDIRTMAFLSAGRKFPPQLSYIAVNSSPDTVRIETTDIEGNPIDSGLTLASVEIMTYAN